MTEQSHPPRHRRPRRPAPTLGRTSFLGHFQVSPVLRNYLSSLLSAGFPVGAARAGGFF